MTISVDKLGTGWLRRVESVSTPELWVGLWVEAPAQTQAGVKGSWKPGVCARSPKES